MPKVKITLCGLYNAARAKEDVELNYVFSYTLSSDSFKVALSWSGLVLNPGEVTVLGR
jgi:hypothetical protein